MIYKYLSIIGSFMTGIALTLLFVSGLRTPQPAERAVDNNTLYDESSETQTSSALQSTHKDHEVGTYSSYISGNETRYGGAHISDTQITGNVSVHGGLTAYNIKAYAGTINGGATITNGFFEDALTVHGGLTGRNIDAHSLKIVGAAALYNTTITATLNVHGGLDARKLSARAAQIQGGAVITDAHLTEQLRVTGKATLIDSNVPEIVLHTPKIASWFFGLFGASEERTPAMILQHSQVDNVTVNTDSSNEKVHVKVTHESNVDSITFSGRPGVVILDDTSTVKSVLNGTIQAETTQ